MLVAGRDGGWAAGVQPSQGSEQRMNRYVHRAVLAGGAAAALVAVAACGPPPNTPPPPPPPAAAQAIWNMNEMAEA